MNCWAHVLSYSCPILSIGKMFLFFKKSYIFFPWKPFLVFFKHTSCIEFAVTDDYWKAQQKISFAFKILKIFHLQQ